MSNETTSAPPSIDSRVTGAPAHGEWAIYATPASMAAKHTIHGSHVRMLVRFTARSGGCEYDIRPTSSRIDIASRDAGPYSRNSQML